MNGVMIKIKNLLVSSILILVFVISAQAQEELFSFGEVLQWGKMVKGNKTKGESINWIQVNTLAETWGKKGKELICHGKPIGVIRSGKKFRNFMMHIEWKHMESGGNSGTFVWSDAEPGDNGLPNGVEVQMLELDWVKLNKRDGKEPPIAYVHGELFGVGGVTVVPDNPRGERSKSIENRCKGKGEWNVYDVVCIDGTIKLSVNGRFVNGISKSSKTEGYICLESEGAEIYFRNLKIVELP